MISRLVAVCFLFASAGPALAQSATTADPAFADTSLHEQTAATGSSTISGQVFAKDPPPRFALINWNFRQYPPPGTPVILMPYTPELKEWLRRADSGEQMEPLDGMLAAIRSAPTGHEGAYEFTGLMPGRYLVYTQFGYLQSARKTHVVGYTDHYAGNLYQGSSPIKHYERYSVGADARIEEVVTIRKDGDVVKQDLKRTR